MKDYYKILGVAPSASSEEVRAAFRDLAKRNHPDRFVTYLQKLHATARMQELNEAYSVLKDPNRRKQYDAKHGVVDQKPPATPAGVTAPYPSHASNRWERVIYAATILVSAAATPVYMSGIENASIGRWIAAFFLSLFLTPIALMSVGFTLAGPLYAAGMMFREAYAMRTDAKPPTLFAAVRDLTIRGAALAAAVTIFAKAVSAGVSIELVYLMLLAAMGFLVGEIAAMFTVWFRRAAVDRLTANLLGTSSTTAGWLTTG